MWTGASHKAVSSSSSCEHRQRRAGHLQRRDVRADQPAGRAPGRARAARARSRRAARRARAAACRPSPLVNAQHLGPAARREVARSTASTIDVGDLRARCRAARGAGPARRGSRCRPPSPPRGGRRSAGPRPAGCTTTARRRTSATRSFDAPGDRPRPWRGRRRARRTRPRASPPARSRRRRGGPPCRASPARRRRRRSARDSTAMPSSAASSAASLKFITSPV